MIVTSPAFGEQLARSAGVAMVSSFYLCEDFAGKGPRVVLLVEEKWTAFLKIRGGLPRAPFFSRPSRAGEPATHANGHPWAWLYTPDEVLKDEARWLSAEAYEEFRLALEGANHDLKKASRELVVAV